MTPPFSIGSAMTAADLTDIARLFRAYQASLDVDLCFQDFAGELAGLPGKYAPPAGALLLARHAGGVAPGGLPLGCVALRPILAGRSGEVKRLYVDPAGRGLGVGRALVTAVITAARRIGYSELYLDTLPAMIAAQALYRSAGFEEIAPYYETPVEGTIFMRLRIPAGAA